MPHAVTDLKNGYRWATSGDVNAFFGLMLDNIADLLLTVSLLATVFQLDATFALQHLVPGTAVGIGWTNLYPWHINLVTTPPYVLIGFVLSLLLATLYGRLDVGPASFGRALGIILVASLAGGVLWSVTFIGYQCHVANGIHSLVIDGPSPEPRAPNRT